MWFFLSFLLDLGHRLGKSPYLRLPTTSWCCSLLTTFSTSFSFFHFLSVTTYSPFCTRLPAGAQTIWRYESAPTSILLTANDVTSYTLRTTLLLGTKWSDSDTRLSWLELRQTCLDKGKSSPIITLPLSQRMTLWLVLLESAHQASLGAQTWLTQLANFCSPYPPGSS